MPHVEAALSHVSDQRHGPECSPQHGRRHIRYSCGELSRVDTTNTQSVCRKFATANLSTFFRTLVIEAHWAFCCAPSTMLLIPFGTHVTTGLVTTIHAAAGFQTD